MKNILIINEQHTLFSEQEEILNKLGGYETIKVPSAGWDLKKMNELVNHYIIQSQIKIIFASPIPYLIKEISYFSGKYDDGEVEVLVFHNDNRNKKELPNGKIISVVAETGWQLV